jgi:hypothetical protein
VRDKCRKATDERQVRDCGRELEYDGRIHQQIHMVARSQQGRKQKMMKTSILQRNGGATIF